MQTTHSHQVSTQQFVDLDDLCTTCKNADGNIVALYKHLLSKKRYLPCNISLYQQKQLMGFLSTFFFYEDACEVAVMVAPSSRRQGIATQLIREVLPLLHSQAIKTLIFSTPNGLNDPWLREQGFHYRNSEYQMQRDQIEPIVKIDQSLSFRPVVDTDLSTLYAIDGACFQEPDLSTRFQTVLHDPNYSLFVAQKDGVPIGKAHIHWQKECTRLTDIAILPQFQGQGFGAILRAGTN